jgi:hypothetical protein
VSFTITEKDLTGHLPVAPFGPKKFSETVSKGTISNEG